jgi:hypothetical protein
MNTSPELAEALEQLHEMDPLRYEPLKRTIRRAEDGSPLKTALAVKFPLLTRRERRALQRAARKKLRETS